MFFGGDAITWLMNISSHIKINVFDVPTDRHAIIGYEDIIG